MSDKTVIMDSNAMQRAIARISYEIIEHNKGVDDVVIIGILTRGVELARRIGNKIFEVEKKRVPIGSLDITSFRDDKKVQVGDDKTDIEFIIENKIVVLVDDVIYTGRSVRAAFDAVMARGRPRVLELAVLVDRGHRELPIRADFVGKNLPTSREENVKVTVLEIDGCDGVFIQ